MNFDEKKFDQIILELASKSAPFSGERFTPGSGIQICYEHIHRYLFATKFLRKNCTVLDLGCGIGYGSILLALHGVEVIAVDIDPESINLLKEIAAKFELSNIKAIIADVNDLETTLKQAERIDLVVCHEVIEHLDHNSQQKLIKAVATGNSPFSQETIFLVSTPDKELYDLSRSNPNPFHLHELTRKSFDQLLKENFKHVKIFEQNNATVNYLKSLDPKDSKELTISNFMLGWQDTNLNIPGLSSSNSSQAEYLYAVASNSSLNQMADISFLTDSSNQYIKERLSIAAKELRENQTKLALLDNLAGQICSDLNIKNVQDILPISQEIRALKELISRQAQKIRDSQLQAERIGYELRMELNKSIVKIRKMDALINTLKPWHAMGGSLLGATPELAAQEYYRLKSYEAAMNAPLHKLAAFIGKVLRTILPVRFVKRFVKFLQALRTA